VHGQEVETLHLRLERDFERNFPTDGISRPIGDVRRFPAFDGLRAIAAVSVVALHAAFYSGFAKRSGYAIYTARLEVGVSVFFVISGFLLYRPFVVSHLHGQVAPKAFRFWIRRLFRIVPAYWLALTVIVYVLHQAVIPGGWSGALIQYSFLQIYVPTSIFFGITQAWSLCTEMSFYLFLPLYAAAIAYRRGSASRQIKRELWGLLALVATSVLFRTWVLTHQTLCTHQCFTDPPVTSLMTSWLPAYLDLFAIGMFLAVISAWFGARDSESSWLRHRAMPWVSWGLAIAAFWAVSHLGISPLNTLYIVTPGTNILKQTLYGLFALFLVAPAVFGPQEKGAIRRLLRLAPMAWLGVVSYGIYLWHQAMIQEFFNITGDQQFAVSFWILFFAAVGLSTIVATISYLGMEQPLLEFASRITRRKPRTMSNELTLRVKGNLPEYSRRHREILTTARSLVTERWRSWRRSFGVRWFLPGLLAIVVLGIGIRVGFAIGWTFGKPLGGDALFFHQSAATLANGRGYLTNFLGSSRLVPTAERPPLFPMLLGSLDLMGFHSVDAQRIALALISSLGVFLTGILGHRVAGPVVGLLAAVIAAVQPLWFQFSGTLMSESLYLVVVPAVLRGALICPSRRHDRVSDVDAQ
jgi:peptidoglycan/LPS O-acetylase OafA/YrhL